MSSLEFDAQKSDVFTSDYFLQGDVCRLCWRRNAEKEIIENSLENCEEEKCAFVDKIRYCLGLDFSTASYPKKSCASCFQNVEKFYDFKQFCQKNDEKLREILKVDAISSHYDVETLPYGVKEEKFDIPDLLFPRNSIFSSFDNDLSLVELPVEKYIKNDDFINIELTKTNSIESLFDNFKPDEDFTTEYLDSKKLKVKKKYKHKRSSTYCNICHTDFGNVEKFMYHNSEAHGIEIDGQFKCFGCNKRFKTRKTRLGHEIKYCKGLKDGYKCEECNGFLPNRKTYESHMRSHGQNTKIELPDDIFKCIKCSTSFTTMECLKKHMQAHDEGKKNYICESCGRIFTRQDYLHKHRLTHSGERQHACPHCGFRAAQRSSLIVHIRKHTGERPYSCDVCSLRCVSSSNLRAHRKRHLGLKNYECSICQKKFGYKVSLEEHVAATHERSQSYPCEYCGAIYTRLRGLRRHLIAKHGKGNKTVSTNEREKSTEVIVSSVEEPVLSTEKNVQEIDVLDKNELCIEKSVLANEKDVAESQYYLKIVCVETSK